MISFPNKRIFSLIGAPRSGKDSVARFLEETRGFVSLAFADQIKKEFGISAADFEAAKIAGNIEELRKELWNFSASKKAKDPLYFIKSVIHRACSVNESVVITDIRTENELNMFYRACSDAPVIKRVYFTMSEKNVFSSGFLDGSELSNDIITKHLCESDSMRIRIISNNENGLFYFHKHLDNFFFREDVKDLLNYAVSDKIIDKYLSQYDVVQIRKASHES